MMALNRAHNTPHLAQSPRPLPNEQGDSTQTIGGFHTNHFIRTPHGWKIKSCKLTMTWSKGNWESSNLRAGA
jgi:hypothetical protein